MKSVLVYNVLLLAIEVIALVAVRRSKRAVFAVAFTQPVAALVLASILGNGIFGAMGMAAYGVFIHTPLIFIAAAVIVRQKSNPLFYTLVVIALANIAIGIDAFLIEPHALGVSRHTVTSAKISRPIRVALIADLQMKEFGDYERNALRTVLAENPDLIVFAGDYLQVADRHEYERTSKEISEFLTAVHFKARLGVYAVPGNVDRDGWVDIFSPAGIEVFPTTRSVEQGEVEITGLSLKDSFNTRLRIAASDRFHIVFGHGPDFALSNLDADLLLAGHTHGGQVVLPGIGPLMTLSAVPKSWASGRTDLDRNQVLIVSRGVGLERGSAPPLRFLCRPEIVVVDVKPIGTT